MYVLPYSLLNFKTIFVAVEVSCKIGMILIGSTHFTAAKIKSLKKYLRNFLLTYEINCRRNTIHAHHKRKFFIF